MKDHAIQCLDTRIHDLGLEAFTVDLVRKEWQVRVPSGGVYQFWLAQAGDENNIYVWVRVWEKQA